MTARARGRPGWPALPGAPGAMSASLAGAAAEVSAAVARTAATVSRSTPALLAICRSLALGSSAMASRTVARFASAAVGFGWGTSQLLYVSPILLTYCCVTLQCLAIRLLRPPPAVAVDGGTGWRTLAHEVATDLLANRPRQQAPPSPANRPRHHPPTGPAIPRQLDPPSPATPGKLV
jgi:hypothetical protein